MPVGSEVLVSRGLPQSMPDSPIASRQPRGGRYGEIYSLPIFNNCMAMSDEGSYFVATNPTISTGIAFGGAAITAFNDTTGAGLALYNADQLGGKRIYLDYIKLIMATIPTGTLAAPFMQMALKLDNVASRYTSGGSAITPVNPNGDVPANSISRLYFGALTLAASSSAARILGRGAVRSAAPVIGDKYLISFGSIPDVAAQSYALATAGAFTIGFPPVIIGPGQVLSLHHWCGGQTAAPVYEFEMGWVER